VRQFTALSAPVYATLSSEPARRFARKSLPGSTACRSAENGAQFTFRSQPSHARRLAAATPSRAACCDQDANGIQRLARFPAVD
jgi:hypothetical protein